MLKINPNSTTFRDEYYILHVSRSLQPFSGVATVAQELTALLDLGLFHDLEDPLYALLRSDGALPFRVPLHHPAKHTLQLLLLRVGDYGRAVRTKIKIDENRNQKESRQPQVKKKATYNW